MTLNKYVFGNQLLASYTLGISFLCSGCNTTKNTEKYVMNLPQVNESKYIQKPLEKQVEHIETKNTPEYEEYLWKSLSLETKVYVLKTAYKDLPEKEQKEVINYLLYDLLENKSISLSSKAVTIINCLRKKDNSGKSDVKANYKLLESFVIGGK